MNYKKEPISNSLIKKYFFKYRRLKHVRITEDTKGIALIDIKTDDLIGIVQVDTKRNYIIALEVFENFKRQGYSSILLGIATKELNAKFLSVNKNNKVAIKIYENYGFKTYDENNHMLFMKI